MVPPFLPPTFHYLRYCSHISSSWALTTPVLGLTSNLHLFLFYLVILNGRLHLTPILCTTGTSDNIYYQSLFCNILIAIPLLNFTLHFLFHRKSHFYGTLLFLLLHPRGPFPGEHYLPLVIHLRLGLSTSAPGTGICSRSAFRPFTPSPSLIDISVSSRGKVGLFPLSFSSLQQ